MSWWPSFIILHVAVPFSEHPLLKEYTIFPQWIFLAPWSHMTLLTVHVCGFISGLIILFHWSVSLFLMPILYCFNYCSLVIEFQIMACDASSFVLPKDCFGYGIFWKKKVKRWEWGWLHSFGLNSWLNGSTISWAAECGGGGVEWIYADTGIRGLCTWCIGQKAISGRVLTGLPLGLSLGLCVLRAVPCPPPLCPRSQRGWILQCCLGSWVSWLLAGFVEQESGSRWESGKRGKPWYFSPSLSSFGSNSSLQP